MIQNELKLQCLQYFFVCGVIIFMTPKIHALQLSGPGLGAHIIMPARYFFIELYDSEKRCNI